jgi:DNA-binding NarL/FixJ family response regulator
MVTSDHEIRILISDDHTLFREGIAEILAHEPDLVIVGQADSGSGTVAVAQRLLPDVILLDVEMPGPGPEETVRELLHVVPATRIVMLTMHDDPRLVERLITAGAHAYVVKGAERAELLGAIRGVMKSDDHVVISISRDSISRFREVVTSPLSSRELQVLTAVSAGLTNAQIATRLFISEGTVKRHLTNIYMKLEVTTRVNAINKAVSIGLIASKEHGQSH